MKTQLYAYKSPVFTLVILLIAIIFNCSSTGLVSEKYPESLYKIPKLLPDEPIQANSTFIIYSDNQAGWRGRERFLKKTNWTNWKIVLFPFYELYLIGNGIIGGIDWLRHTPDYGGKERRLVRDAIYAEAKRSQASFILNVGDITAHDGRRPSHWLSFLNENKVEHPLLKEIPFLPTIGNHEHANDSTYGYANYKAIFDYPRFYTVEFADAVLIIVDSNYIIDQYQDIDDDIQDDLFKSWFVSDDNSNEEAWLEKQLAAYDKPFKIIAMHHPPASYSMHHNDWYNPSFGNDLVEKRQQLFNLFQMYGVQVVFSGHDHLYQHNKLQSPNGNQIHFLGGGGGGAPLRDIVDMQTQKRRQQNFENEGFKILPVNQERIYHYYRVRIESDKLTIEVFEVADVLEEPIRLAEKIVIDSD